MRYTTCRGNLSCCVTASVFVCGADAAQDAVQTTVDVGAVEVLAAQLTAAEAAVAGAERQRSYLEAEKVRY